MHAFRTGSGQKFAASCARRTPLPLLVAAGLFVSVLVGTALVGCADLDRLEADACGNGVVEPGEDCEPADEIDGVCGAAGTVAGCFFLCDHDSVECPDGWSCGADGLCYQGDGSFALASSLRINGDRSELVDFTADRFDDLAVSSPDIVRFRFGPFIEEELSEPVAATRGLGAVDINRDGAHDGLLAGPESWYILLGSPDFTVGSSFPPSRSFGLGQHWLGMAPVSVREFSAQLVPAGLSSGQVCGNGNACAVLYASPSVIQTDFPLEQAAGPLAAATLGERSEQELDVRVAYAARGSQTVGIAEVQCTGDCDNVRELILAGETPATVSTGSRAGGQPDSHLNPVVAAGGVHFGDVEGDGDQDLLVWTHDENGAPGLGVLFNQEDANQAIPRRLVGTCGAPVCDVGGIDTCDDDLDVRVYANQFESSGDVEPGDLLAVGQLDGRWNIDLVTSTGIFLASDEGESAVDCGFSEGFTYQSSGWFPAYQEWSEAVVGDFNGDGVTDVAAINYEVPQIEIYRGNRSGALTRLVIDTDQPPATISAGDLDADGADDLTFAVELDSETSDIRVRWGRAAGLERNTRSIGQSFLVRSRGLAMGPSVTALGEFDADAELFIAGISSSGVAGANQTSIALVQGSANRALSGRVFGTIPTLLTAYDPPPSPDRTHCIGTVAAGRFFQPEDTDGDGIASLDIAALGSLVENESGRTTQQLCEESTTTRFPVLEGRRGAGNGNLDASAPWCEAMPTDAVNLCARSSLMTAIDLDGDELDELAIVGPVAEGGATCAVSATKTNNLVLIAVPSASGSPSADVCAPAFQPRVVTSVSGVLTGIERRPLDDQPGEDLLVTTFSEVVLLAGAASTLEGPMTITGLPMDGCDLLASHTLEAGCTGAVDLATLHDCDGIPRVDVWSVDWAQGAATLRLDLPTPPEDEWSAGGASELRIGDIDGTGLDDIFARTGGRGYLFTANEAPTVGSEDVCRRLD